MTHPRNMTAVEGQRVLFNCGAEAFPDNITYYWYKDRVDVRQLPVFNKRLTLSEGKLLLTGVVKELYRKSREQTDHDFTVGVLCLME